MRTSTPMLAALIFVGAGLTSDGVIANPKAEAAADKAALEWLKLVDRGDYGQSWENAAPLFKQAVTKQQWDAAVKATRQPLGTVVERAVASRTYAESLPGAPDGHYVVIQFKTRYANKKKAIETVTPMRGPDGKWRVSGYYVK